jgi:hypothetical protein
MYKVTQSWKEHPHHRFQKLLEVIASKLGEELKRWA